MNTVIIDVDIRQLNLLAQKIEEIANKQSLDSRSTEHKTRIDSSSIRTLKQDITLSHMRKKRDISQTKRLY